MEYRTLGRSGCAVSTLALGTMTFGNELQVHFLLDATRVRSEDALAATETHELEGLQTLQTGGVRAAGVARVSPRSELKAGSRATFAVDTERLNFFDNENGAAIWA